MDFKQLTDRVKALVGGRGGTQSVKEDGSEGRDVHSGDDTTEDKPQPSADAISEPGGHQEDMGVGADGTEEPSPGAERTPGDDDRTTSGSEGLSSYE